MISMHSSARWLAAQWLAGWLVLSCGTIAWAQRTDIILKDGTRLGPGLVGDLSTISKDSAQRGQQETMSLSIKAIDDELRVTYFNKSHVASEVLSTKPVEEIVLPLANEAQHGAGQFGIRSVLSVTQFNKHGCRFYSFVGGKSNETLFQGITHLTPLYARVQTLKEPGVAFRPWDQRIATNSIAPQVLSDILHHELNMKSPEDRMRIFRFYLQAGRYVEARDELIDALKAFPEQLVEQKALLVTLENALAEKMFSEAEIRRRSGQPKYVAGMLQRFEKDASGDDSETMLKVRDQLTQIKDRVTQLAGLVATMKANLAELPPADAALVGPVIKEIENEISWESQDRFDDYNRFVGQNNLKAEQKISFAIGGWLLGRGSGVDNYEVAKSAIRVHALVKEYLTGADKTRREDILEKLNREEAGRPELVGKVISAMKPPLPLPEVAEEDPPGLHRIVLPKSETVDQCEYTVQLPPEYDPRRLYPCIVALPGLGNPRDMPISWWCGAYNAKVQQRFGLATQYGYIVVSPKWAEDGQLQYNYTGLEHDRVLRCVRDAYRRLSIDTNRVFISGHFDGGAVAWDIALSHPDMWAGAVMLSPSAEKFILMYGRNAAYVPTYTVWGQFDMSSLMANLGRTVDDYLKKPQFDAIGVEYKGRPRDHFLEEVPRIMDWMEMTNHRREPNPREINVEAARAGDRFFYWFEMPEIDPDKLVSPVMFDMKRENRIEVKLQPAGTAFLLNKFPAKEAWVWLRPGLITFGQTVTVQVKSSTKKIQHVFKGDNRVLLEDVRMRGDRIAPFYDRIETNR